MTRQSFRRINNCAAKFETVHRPVQTLLIPLDSLFSGTMAIPRFTGQLGQATSLQGAQLRGGPPVVARPVAAGAPRVRRRRLTFPEVYMLGFWVLVLTDVHRWIADAPRGPRD